MWEEWEKEYDAWDYTPPMAYTYQGGEYPKEIKLNYPEIEDIVAKSPQKISDAEIEMMLSLAPDKLRKDLQNIVLREIGRSRDNDDKNWFHICTSFMFLTAVCTTEDTLPVVLEVMRQSETFYDFYINDFPNYVLGPILYILAKDNPRLFKPFLLEAGLAYQFKFYVLELMQHIAINIQNARQEIIDMSIELLEEYKLDLPKRTICDGTITAFAIGILVVTNATEHLPLIEELYATGLVDESIEGHIDEVRREIHWCHEKSSLPAKDPYSIREEFRKLLGQ